MQAALLLLQYAKHPYDRVLLLEEENELGSKKVVKLPRTQAFVQRNPSPKYLESVHHLKSYRSFKGITHYACYHSQC